MDSFLWARYPCTLQGLSRGGGSSEGRLKTHTGVPRSYETANHVVAAAAKVSAVSACPPSQRSSSSNTCRSHARPFEPSIKSRCWEILTTFGDKCPQNGSKNEQTAPRTSMGYTHEEPSVDQARLTTHTLLYRATSLKRNNAPLEPYSRHTLRALRWS